MTEQERAEYLENAYRNARRHGVPSPPKFNIGLQLREGDVLLSEQWEEGHSWVRNMWNMQYATFLSLGGDGVGAHGAGYMSARGMDGTVRAVTTVVPINTNSVTTGIRNILTTTAAANYGILVGTSAVAFNINDYALVQCGHSTGGATTGTFEYRAMPAYASGYDAATKRWTVTHSRDFAKGGSDSVTVREVGLAGLLTAFHTTAASVLLARDVLESAVTVAPGQVLTVQYQFMLDFSSID